MFIYIYLFIYLFIFNVPLLECCPWQSLIFFLFIFVPWPISVTQQELNKYVLNKWRRKCVWDTEVIKIIEAKSRNKKKERKTGKENLKNNVRLCEEIQKRVKPLKPKVFTCERKEREKNHGHFISWSSDYFE